MGMYGRCWNKLEMREIEGGRLGRSWGVQLVIPRSSSAAESWRGLRLKAEFSDWDSFQSCTSKVSASEFLHLSLLIEAFFLADSKLQWEFSRSHTPALSIVQAS